MDASSPATANTAQIASAQALQGEICELSQRFFFEAAHTLQRTTETEGSLRIHGHTYHAEVTIAGTPDEHTGMLIDLGYLRSHVARIRDLLDHQFLDEVPTLAPATLERLCAFIRDHLREALPGLCCVMVERQASGDRCVLRCAPIPADCPTPATDSGRLLAIGLR
jgi:6-pyruvoyltetrahydropterin/6-carboxytetrahydropterin synthase